MSSFNSYPLKDNTMLFYITTFSNKISRKKF